MEDTNKIEKSQSESLEAQIHEDIVNNISSEPSASLADDAEMSIYVKNSVGSKITISVQQTDTIKNLKEKIFDKTGIRADDQRLVYEGKRLYKEGRTIGEHNIQKASVLGLMPVLRGGETLHIQPLGGRTLDLVVDWSETVSSIKSIIHDMEGTPPDQQALIYRDETLENTKTLSEYHIKTGSVLHLVRRLRGGTVERSYRPLYELCGCAEFSSIRYELRANSGFRAEGKHMFSSIITITIQRADEESFTIEVNLSDTIDMLKTKIQQTIGLSIEQQRLSIGENELENQRTMFSYNITEGTVIELNSTETRKH